LALLGKPVPPFISLPALRVKKANLNPGAGTGHQAARAAAGQGRLPRQLPVAARSVRDSDSPEIVLIG